MMSQSIEQQHATRIGINQQAQPENQPAGIAARQARAAAALADANLAAYRANEIAVSRARFVAQRAEIAAMQMAQLRATLPVIAPPSTYEIFISGEQVELDLIVKPPANSDPDLWLVPTWSGYATAFLVPVPLGEQDGQAEFRLVWPTLLTYAQVLGLWGVAVSWRGFGLFAWPIDPDQPAGTLTVDVFLALVQTP
jgi:hypothetical protein